VYIHFYQRNCTAWHKTAF